MLKIFTGDDRIRAQQEIKKLLGEDYEVVDCANLAPRDLSKIFLGTTLFASHRRILMRDFTANASIYPELKNYLNTSHDVILFETKLDKRTSTYKEIKDNIEIREFKLPESANFRQVFDIYKVAKTDGKRAVLMLQKIEPDEDPYRFTGLLISQALKDFQQSSQSGQASRQAQGTKESRALKNLAKLDLQMKSTSIAPWLLVESFLLNLAN